MVKNVLAGHKLTLLGWSYRRMGDPGNSRPKREGHLRWPGKGQGVALTRGIRARLVDWTWLKRLIGPGKKGLIMGP